MNMPLDEEIAIMTPMLKQYFNLKKKCHDAVLFFRMGDFYEVFGKDAERIAPAINIVLTSRERGDKQKIKFCGVPHHSAQGYWMKLLALNFKIAVAEQIEDPKIAKGLVKRDISKIMTPACLDELDALESSEPNYLMAIYEDPQTRKWSVTLSDLSTGEFRLGQVLSFEEIKKLILHFKPKEVLIRKFLKKSLQEFLNTKQDYQNILISELSESVLNDKNIQKKILRNVFRTYFEKSKTKDYERSIVSSTLQYFIDLHASLGHFRTIKPLKDPDTINLNETAFCDLEIIETSRHKRKEGSLFSQINYTLTPMGSRLLRWTLAHPFVCEERITNRQTQISDILTLGSEDLSNIRSFLTHSGDLERLNTRIISKRIRPVELAKIKETLKQMISFTEFFKKNISAQSKTSITPLIQKILYSKKVYSILEDALLDSPGNLGEGSKVFKTNYDNKLAKHISFAQDGTSKVDDYQESLRKETNINNLKIKYHKTYGLVIEVSKGNLSKVPPNFIRKQTMINYERFVTETLKDLDEELRNARDYAIEREEELYFELLTRLEKEQKNIKDLAVVWGELDLITALAYLALTHNYSRAKLNKQEKLELKNSRHPVVENFVGKHKFVANNVFLDKKSKQLVITGPNMAGKSTIMRQVALCALLNQIGSYVPAEEANLPIFDNIFTRVGVSDDLSEGLSTFMVEMKEAAQIIEEASCKSLVILDEVGRGTSTEDGLALASSILEYIANSLKSWTLFSTHYHELVPFAQKCPGIHISQTEVIELQNSIDFTHRLIPGASGCSFGIEVAKLAGLPKDILSRAEKLLIQNELSSSEKIRTGHKSENMEVSKTEARFTEISSRLEKINLNRTSPLQALNILSELIAINQKNPSKSLFHDGQTFF